MSENYTNYYARSLFFVITGLSQHALRAHIVDTLIPGAGELFGELQCRSFVVIDNKGGHETIRPMLPIFPL